MSLGPAIEQGIPPEKRGRWGWFRLSAWTIAAATLGMTFHFSANLGLFALEPRLAPSFIPSKPIAGGALVIHGGGRLTEEVRSRFIELAGGPQARILVVPTAQSDAESPEFDRMMEFWRPQPVESVALFHTRSRLTADDGDFLRPLQEATGVWLCGGLQSSISKAYVGTGVDRELKALLERGGVVGGTSAGAAVMSRIMIDGGRTRAKLGEGFGFLDDAVFDQHFLRRNRMSRLEGVVREHAGCFGLGIDEGTALVVGLKDKRARVLGESYVVAVLPDVQDGVSLTRCEFLKPGDEADLVKLRTAAKGAVVSAVDFDSL